MDLKNLFSDRIKLCSVGIIITAIIFMIFRILFPFFDFPPFMEEFLDGDFYILLDHMKGGLSHFYDPDKARAAIYLYYWYFMFFPFYIIPSGISVYLWDILRLILFLYIINNLKNITRNDFALYGFILLSYIGFFFDAYLGNSNFLILFFLFMSFKYLEKGNVWLAGLFMALACFKITSIIFLIILLIIRKIKIKEIPKYLAPLLLLLIPYIVFPPLLIQFIDNLFILEDAEGNIISPPDFGNPILNFLARIYLFIWQALQPAQIMVYSFFLLLIFQYFIDKKSLKKDKNLETQVLSNSKKKNRNMK
ncbi:MAG: DUF2029 domain-containing protein [Promethearchaeota archaeon]|nr:MAG: DUF2029 domain-containing protein [Candidatus Lokiarchaeota archaeon]